MEAVRRIVSVDMLSPIVSLPWKRDMQVEVVITPIEEDVPQQKIPFQRLEGCLKEYANPALWEQEQYAWENSVIEKYSNGTI